jgi:hypothetical protein
MRLYLIDMPEGSSMRILAIAIVAPEARFDAVMRRRHRSWTRSNSSGSSNNLSVIRQEDG